jgi:hypothetical protein
MIYPLPPLAMAAVAVSPPHFLPIAMAAVALKAEGGELAFHYTDSGGTALVPEEWFPATRGGRDRRVVVARSPPR